MSIPTHQLLREQREHTEQVIQRTRDNFGPLPPAQLHRQPAPDRWSIAQCLDHLNRYGDYYLPAMEAAIRQQSHLQSQPPATFQPGWMGDYFARIMAPKNGEIKNKMPAPRDKHPAQNEVPPDVIVRFLKQQDQLLKIIEQAAKVDLNRARVPVTIAPWIKLKLGDCLRVVVNHNLRHVLQAQRVLEKVVGSG